MKKNYQVTIETKNGNVPFPSTERIRYAVADCEVHIGEDFENVEVSEVEHPIEPLIVRYKNAIFGVARWDAANSMWEFCDYYNVAHKARSAAARATKRCKAMGLNWEYSVLRFSQADHLWYQITAAE